MIEAYWLVIPSGRFVKVENHIDSLTIHEKAVQLGLPEPYERLIRGFDYASEDLKITTIAMEAGFVSIRRISDSLTCKFTFPLEVVLPCLERFLRKTKLDSPDLRLTLWDLKRMIHAELQGHEFTELLGNPPRTWVASFQTFDTPERAEIKEGLRLAATIGASPIPSQKPPKAARSAKTGRSAKSAKPASKKAGKAKTAVVKPSRERNPS